MNDEIRTKFLDWQLREVVNDARGDNVASLDIPPSGRFWLGRLTPEEKAALNPMGDRGERLEPCAIGIRALIKEIPTSFQVIAAATAWTKGGTRRWHKLAPVTVEIAISISSTTYDESLGKAEFESAFVARGVAGLSARIDVSCEKTIEGQQELFVQLVNCTPSEIRGNGDTNLYECSLTLTGIQTNPFNLEALPDSFRYDRNVDAYGHNCGVERTQEGAFRTTDLTVVDRARPNYWGPSTNEPDLSFERLVSDPIGAGRDLLTELEKWQIENWSSKVLNKRALDEAWTAEMQEEASTGAEEFNVEVQRIREGVELLESNSTIRTCFQRMNAAIRRSSRNKYHGWRAFQFGFMLANLRSIVDCDEDRNVVDVVWFSTGGGKTETYLGLLITAILYDRYRGKLSGITAWSRFPLRMLSLQQTQRFADALAAAELERRALNLGGDPFSLGFFVGGSSTPNKITEEDADDTSKFPRYRVLERCPFCDNKDLSMAFDTRHYVLRHRCKEPNCESGGNLPIYVVDDEIYRFLPTVVVGTLDKAASISIQAAMRGFVAAPLGMCSTPGHGYTYATRKASPNGCLVPRCKAKISPLPQDPSLYPPDFRLQDELHLLRDSLGAIDAHYEAVYDALQTKLGGRVPKILASSATLAGYQGQIDVLYRRTARVFPCLPPKVGHGFWSKETSNLMRRFIAIAPRGVTIDFAVDRMLTILQGSVRRLVDSPDTVCAEIGVDVSNADDLISLYGTDVVYGNTLRDLEAVARSAATQVLVDGPLNVESLTGKTDFDSIRLTLDRLQAKIQPAFQERIHIVTASAMMSHGVDIDRLNVMVMLGLPLSAAEFIQATARVGRTYPGMVFVMHKIGRERDSTVFRAFSQFVSQGDRFVEPIPITRRSRRVLECTLPGIALARVHMVHEAAVGGGITNPEKLRELLDAGSYDPKVEIEEIARALEIEGDLDENLLTYLQTWFAQWEENLRHPIRDANVKFLGQHTPGGKGPMASLRDVETSVNIWGRRI